MSDTTSPMTPILSGLGTFNRRTLIDVLERGTLKSNPTVRVDGDGYGVLEIRMPCGAVHWWESLETVPEQSVPCRCGDPSHFALRYFEESQ